jgi:hypothetical protein
MVQRFMKFNLSLKLNVSYLTLYSYGKFFTWVHVLVNENIIFRGKKIEVEGSLKTKIFDSYLGR